MTDLTETIWLTQDAYDKLRAEYDHLIGAGREEVTAKIARARDEGDLSENAGYHAARDEQGQQELRIRQLKAILDQAQVGTAPDSDVVHPGMKVTIAFDGDPDDTDTFLLGSREVVGLDDSIDLAVYSPQSPLGAAITGLKIGDEATYTAPNGRPITVTILEAEAF
ncbi:MAG TPA: transcription elongation factor GreA [Propionibacteriaceae bacterium]|nr:transcription elongation factor GreA [Propionibacteriaceae bacterium]HPZ49058.1 transcription elongation factor GreA [Propionibacteriaceae bacterium]HQE31768.1 transcription elongation factor GreA [Propionibacteriaceae bacterium]